MVPGKHTAGIPTDPGKKENVDASARCRVQREGFGEVTTLPNPMETQLRAHVHMRLVMGQSTCLWALNLCNRLGVGTPLQQTWSVYWDGL